VPLKHQPFDTNETLTFTIQFRDDAAAADNDDDDNDERIDIDDSDSTDVFHI